jgi:ABC-type glutathione transport system ATPase component
MATLESTAAETLVEAPAPVGRRPAVEVAHLRKTYGTLVTVDDVSFTVTEGEIFGILGPNGAGKTTAIGLRRPDAGTIRLLGLDPHADQDQVHEIVGVQLQSGALPAKLRVGEILEEYRSFYRDPADVDELLDILGLSAKRGDYDGQHVVVTGTGELVNAVILALHAAGVTARDVQLDSSNLEDAFVKLTGKNMHSEGALA